MAVLPVRVSRPGEKYTKKDGSPSEEELPSIAEKKLFLIDDLDRLGQAGNFAGSGFPVDGALSCCLVKNGSRADKRGIGFFRIFFLNGEAHGFNGVFHAGTIGTVARGPLQALFVALDGRLVVSQGNPPKYMLCREK